MSKILLNKNGKIALDKNGTFLMCNTMTISELLTGNLSEYTLEPNIFYQFEDVMPFFEIRLAPPFKGVVNEYNGIICANKKDLEIVFPKTIVWKVDSKVSITNNILKLTKNNAYLYSIHNNLGVIASIDFKQLTSPTLSNLYIDYSLNSAMSHINTYVDHTKLLKWEPVAHADYYEVYLDPLNSSLTNENSTVASSGVATPKTLFKTVTSTELDLSAYFLPQLTHKLLVKACSNLGMDASSNIVLYNPTITKLATPTNLVLSTDGILSWEPIQATAATNVYYVVVAEASDGTITTLTNYTVNTSTSISLLDLGSDTTTTKPTPGTYTIRVRAMSLGLAVPSDYSIDNVKYTWE